MRVLHIGKFFPPFAGGVEHFLGDLLPALQQQGIQVAALVHNHETGLAGATPPVPNPRYNPIPPIYRVPCYGQLLYAPLSPGFPLWLRRAIRDFKPDILHLHMPNTSAFWAMLVPSARRLPWVIHWHSDVVASQLDRRLALAYRLYRPLEQRLLAAGQAIVATSPPYLDSSLALQPWKARCHVIPLGINPQRITEPDPDAFSRADKVWNNAIFKVLAVGRLTYYKGHEILVRAVAKIPDIQLLIVGKGGCRPQLTALIQSLGLEDRVKLIGFVSNSDLAALFTRCDIVCLPSLERTEAFGLVLLEAMHFGKPVIASDIPGSGVGWVLQQGGHGILAPPGDHEKLAAALWQMAQASAQRTHLGRTGNKRLGQLFHIDQVARQINVLYRTISKTPEIAEPSRR